MRFRRLTIFSVVALAVFVTAATAGARIDASHKTTTITFWDAYSTGGAEVQHLEKVVIPNFEKTHPGIVVKDVTIPYDSLHQKLIAGVAGGTLPDLVRSDIIWVPELANLGVLAPLDQDAAELEAGRVDGLPRAARDELLEGPLLRAAARHEHAHLGLQPGRAQGDRRERAARDVRTAEVDVDSGKGEGL